MSNSLPEGARFVDTVAGGIACWDISEQLRQHPTKKYTARKKDPVGIVVHHSGADNEHDGWKAFSPMAGWHVGHHDWPGIGYHYGVTLRPSRDDDNRLILYRLQHPDTLSYHTRGASVRTLGMVLQGHHGDEPLTDFQVEVLEGALPWIADEYDWDLSKALAWHSNPLRFGGAPKLACPGKHAVAYLKAYRAGAAPPAMPASSPT